MLDAQMNNAYIKKTIYDYLEDVKNDPPHLKNRITEVELEAIKAATGGGESTAFRREYLCEIITDSDTAIIPEFDDALKTKIVKDSPMPEQFESYVAMDIGYEDFHAVLFAYYDFVRNKLVIQDEIIVKGRDTNTEKLSKAIKQKERQLWRNSFGEVKSPYLRVCDDDMVNRKDLTELHGLYFTPAKKDGKQAAVNEVRIRLVGDYIEINPRCANLITQLESGIWANFRDGSNR
jgi:hypothetical protein